MLISNKQSDEELVKAAQQGSMEAYTLLYERFISLVYNRVRYLVPAQDVEDVTQEVFVAVIRSLKGFRGESLFSTWLRTITNRRIAEYYRRRPRQDVALGENMNPPHQHLKMEEVVAIRQAFHGLPENYREILLLRFSDGLQFNEIAALQGRSLEAIKSLFRRAIASLHKQVKVDG